VDRGKIVPQGRERHIRALNRVLRGHLKFVVIELEEGDNAQEIFESLNAQGTPLLAIDLVKNHVFRRAADAKINLDELDEQLWRELDAKWWRTEQRQGRFKRPRAELFLMHWLTMRTRREVPALGLFVEFQRQVDPDVVKDSGIRNFVKGFIADARLYRGFDALPEGTVPRRFFDRLELLDTTTLYPIALRLFVAERDGELDRVGRDRALRALESWVVRWPANWPLPDSGPQSPEEHEALEAERDAHVHRLGNLSLVTKRLNPSVGNAAWPVKRTAFDAHSILHLNRDLVRNNESNWSETSIDARGSELAALIVEHWAGPDRFAS
jgi:hypothetical protein